MMRLHEAELGARLIWDVARAVAPAGRGKRLLLILASHAWALSLSRCGSEG